jgi:mRNA-degrading endonuclease RelE of RelBE toxin-antitoxin system
MKSSLTKSFPKCFDKLPKEIRQQADKAYQLWRQDPFHNSLQFKCVNQKQSIYSVRISLNYRALGLMDQENQIYWFWIGPHDEYDELLKRL